MIIATVNMSCQGGGAACNSVSEGPLVLIRLFGRDGGWTTKLGFEVFEG